MQILTQVLTNVPDFVSIIAGQFVAVATPIFRCRAEEKSASGQKQLARQVQLGVRFTSDSRDHGDWTALRLRANRAHGHHLSPATRRSQVLMAVAAEDLFFNKDVRFYLPLPI